MIKYLFHLLLLQLNLYSILCIDYNYTLYFDFQFDMKMSFNLSIFNTNKNTNKKYGNNYYFIGKIIEISKIIENCNHNSKQYKQIDDEDEIEANEKIKISDQETLIYIPTTEYCKTKFIKIIPQNFIIIAPLNMKQNFLKLDIIYNYNVFLLPTNDVKNFNNCIKESINNYSYVIIGKKFQENLSLKLKIICILLLLILIFLYYKRQLKRIRQENILPIHYLFPILFAILFTLIILIYCFYDYFIDFKYYFIFEYLNILVFSIYKGMLYSIIISLLKGWIIFNFKNFSKTIFILVFLSNFILSIIFTHIIYYIPYSDKLSLFLIKNCIGYLVIVTFIFISFICIFSKINRQLKYEIFQKSCLIECYKYKRKKILLVNIFSIIYVSILLILNMVVNFKFKYYANVFILHMVYQVIIEALLVIGFSFIFYPTKLPKYYLREVVFNFNDKEVLLLKSKNILNINKLSEALLEKISKKDKRLIAFISPFNNSVGNIWGGIKLGIISNND